MHKCKCCRLEHPHWEELSMVLILHLQLQKSNTCDLLYLKLFHHVISPPFIAYAIFISFGCLSTGLLCLKLAVLHRCCFWASWVTLWVLCMQGAVVCVICCTWILTVYNIGASHCTCLCLYWCLCASVMIFWCAAGNRQRWDAGLIHLNVNTIAINYLWCSVTLNHQIFIVYCDTSGTFISIRLNPTFSLMVSYPSLRLRATKSSTTKLIAPMQKKWFENEATF